MTRAPANPTRFLKRSSIGPTYGTSFLDPSAKVTSLLSIASNLSWIWTCSGMQRCTAPESARAATSTGASSGSRGFLSKIFPFTRPIRSPYHDTGRSIGLDAGALDDGAPARDLRADVRGEFLRRARYRDRALGVEALAHFRRLHDAPDVGVQLHHDLSRRSRRGDDTVPLHRVEPLDSRFGDGRSLRQRVDALQAGHAQRAKLSGPDMGDHRRDAGNRHRDLAGDQVGDRRTGALVGHVNDVGPGLQLEILHGDVGRATVSRRAVEELPGVRARVGDELRGGVHGKRRVHDEDIRDVRYERYRREAFERVVAEIGVKPGVDRERADVPDENGVAVGGRFCCGLRADRAARAAAVLDDDLLLERLGELQRERAPENIVRAARRERNDHADGSGWINLR